MEITINDIRGLKADCEIYVKNLSDFEKKKKIVLKSALEIINKTIDQNPHVLFHDSFLNFIFKIQ